jgi:hypothetical protein
MKQEKDKRQKVIYSKKWRLCTCTTSVLWFLCSANSNQSTHHVSWVLVPTNAHRVERKPRYIYAARLFQMFKPWFETHEVKIVLVKEFKQTD